MRTRVGYLNVILTPCLDDNRVQHMVSQWHETVHDGCLAGVAQNVHTNTTTLISLRTQHATDAWSRSLLVSPTTYQISVCR
jgi:hypothetical protein